MAVFTLEWLQFVYFINLDLSYSFKDYYFKILLPCLGFVLEVRVHFHGVGIFLHLGFQHQVRLSGWCRKHFSHFEPSPHLWLFLFLRQFLTLTHTVFWTLPCSQTAFTLITSFLPLCWDPMCEPPSLDLKKILTKDVEILPRLTEKSPTVPF